MCKFKNKKLKIFVLAAGLMISVVLSGCTEEKDPAETRVIVEQEAPEVEYTLTTVNLGDIILKKDLNCTYSQINSQNLSFAVSGRIISKVYVREGEVVKKGDLIAELAGIEREDEIERLEYQIERNKLLLAQIDDTENYELSRRWLNKIYSRGFDQTGDIENYQRENEYRREDYRDAIALDEQQLAKIKQEVKQGKIYAGIAGTVSIKKKNLEGSTSVKNETIIEIKDNAECFFVVSDTKYKEYFKEGESYDMSVFSGPGSGKYKVVPYKMSEWQDQMFFSVLDMDESAMFESGNSGSLTVILDAREQVLTLPREVVHEAEGKWYVYVINEAGVRDVKWITVGLKGNEYVEIVEGLTEGEKVIQK